MILGVAATAAVVVGALILCILARLPLFPLLRRLIPSPVARFVRLLLSPWRRRSPLEFAGVELHVLAVGAAGLLRAVRLAVQLQHPRSHTDHVLTADPAEETEELQRAKDVYTKQREQQAHKNESENESESAQASAKLVAVADLC